MAKKKKRKQVVEVAADGSPLSQEVFELDPNTIIINERQRKEFDDAAIGELMENLLAHGQLQPIGVARKGDQWELVYGHRRLLACQRAGINVRCIETRPADDLDSLLKEISENEARRNFTPMESARAVAEAHHKLKEKHEGKWTITDTARVLGVSRNTVCQKLKIAQMVLEHYSIPWEQARMMTASQIKELIQHGHPPAVPDPHAKISVYHGTIYDWQNLGIQRNYFHFMMTSFTKTKREEIERFWATVNQIMLKDKGTVLIWVPFETFFVHVAVAKSQRFPLVHPRPFVWVRSSAGVPDEPALPAMGYDTAIVARRRSAPRLRRANHSDWISLAGQRKGRVVDGPAAVKLGVHVMEVFCEPHWSFIDPIAKSGDFAQAARLYGCPEIVAIEQKRSNYYEIKKVLGVKE